MSDTSSSLLESKLDEVFDQHVEDISQYLKRLRLSQSEERAEVALETFYIALSEEDSRLSQDGRQELKLILAADFLAIKTILDVMKRRYSNAKFYRRALSCLAYLIRDSEENASQFVELGGMEFTVEVMDAFEKNEVIQWYCFDLLGKLVSSSEGYNDLVVENLVSRIVQTMLDMHENTPVTYDRACDSLSTILASKRNIRKAVARHVAGISRSLLKGVSQTLVRGFDEQDGGYHKVDPTLPDKLGRLAVCHDILDMALAR